MAYKRDATDVAQTGHTAIAASMIVFTILCLITWSLIGFQILRARKQRLADLENGTEVGPIDPNIPLEDVLQGSKYSDMKPVPVRVTSLGSWPLTQGTEGTPEPAPSSSSKSGIARDSQWYAEERPVRYFFHKIGKFFKD
ncbi:hypothetical protein GGS24DRAFT_453435 [Hypoxylon argillaceum]|nr:hypothetical protein GGS24DRAFT_453435 [Hypoxylon argillaceum]